MSNNFWQTGYDPQEELNACRHNVAELIKVYTVQQETIQQLVEQNYRLNELMKITRMEVSKMQSELARWRNANATTNR
jgi:hypothetical protein